MEYFTNLCVILAHGPRMTRKDICVCVCVRERYLNEGLIFLNNYQRWITMHEPPIKWTSHFSITSIWITKCPGMDVIRKVKRSLLKKFKT